MKNWDKANAVGFGNDTTECYIDDMMEWVSHGGMVILQQNGDKGEVWFVNQIKTIEDRLNKHELVFLDPEGEAGQELIRVAWNKGKAIKGNLSEEKLYFSWDLSPGTEILIWWDHDLGDVVLDRATKEDMAEQTHQGAEEICNGVWFYWIT